MSELDNQLEDIKVAAALRSEMMKLEYRKKNKPKEVNILDFTVIAALEKQMPKYPENRVRDEYKSLGKNYWCPNCGVMFQTWENKLFRTNYCGECGQRLNTEDEGDGENERSTN